MGAADSQVGCAASELVFFRLLRSRQPKGSCGECYLSISDLHLHRYPGVRCCVSAWHFRRASCVVINVLVPSHCSALALVANTTTGRAWCSSLDVTIFRSMWLDKCFGEVRLRVAQ